MNAQQTPEVDAHEASKLHEQGVLLIDVREPEEWRAGRVAQALHIPLGELGARLDEVPRDEMLIICCRSGARSAYATDALRGAGYEATNLAGGLLAWHAAGLPLEGDGGPGQVA